MTRTDTIRSMRAALFLHSMDLRWQFPGSTRIAVKAIEDFCQCKPALAGQLVRDYRDATCRFVKTRSKPKKGSAT